MVNSQTPRGSIPASPSTAVLPFVDPQVLVPCLEGPRPFRHLLSLPLPRLKPCSQVQQDLEHLEEAFLARLRDASTASPAVDGAQAALRESPVDLPRKLLLRNAVLGAERTVAICCGKIRQWARERPKAAHAAPLVPVEEAQPAASCTLAIDGDQTPPRKKRRLLAEPSTPPKEFKKLCGLARSGMTRERLLGEGGGRPTAPPKDFKSQESARASARATSLECQELAAAISKYLTQHELVTTKAQLLQSLAKSFPLRDIEDCLASLDNLNKIMLSDGSFDCMH